MPSLYLETLATHQIFRFSVPPKIEDNLSSGDKVKTEGSNVTLECYASGSPQPTVTWKREDGQPISIDKANNITGEMSLAWPGTTFAKVVGLL